MAHNKVLYGVETSALVAGDLVVTGPDVDTFLGTEEIPGSEYVRVRWVGYATTAQPWNEWPIVIRLVES